MATYKLIYFNLKGIAEPIRYIFAWSGVDYVDERVDVADWPPLKEKQPFGQLPVLDIGDNYQLSQSLSIARYLGKVFDLTSKDNLQNAKLDGLVEHMLEIYFKHYVFFLKNADTTEFEQVTLPFYFQKFEALAQEGWFLGTVPTWVDVYFAGIIDTLETRLKKPILRDYPYLEEIKTKVEAKMSVQKYLKTRPYNAS